MVTFAAGVYCLLLFDSGNHPFERLVFEAAAALGTVGLSHDITPDLTMPGKIVIMILMFIGRLGVVALALGAVALYHDISHDKHLLPKEEIKEEDIVL
jgi:trk system potassium uptake protein TrkH